MQDLSIRTHTIGISQTLLLQGEHVLRKYIRSFYLVFKQCLLQKPTLWFWARFLGDVYSILKFELNTNLWLDSYLCNWFCPHPFFTNKKKVELPGCRSVYLYIICQWLFSSEIGLFVASSAQRSSELHHEHLTFLRLISNCLICKVHKECLIKWLNVSFTSRCEICGYNFKIKRSKNKLWNCKMVNSYDNITNFNNRPDVSPQ